MDLRYNPEEQNFRDELAEWLASEVCAATATSVTPWKLCEVWRADAGDGVAEKEAAGPRARDAEKVALPRAAPGTAASAPGQRASSG